MSNLMDKMATREKTAATRKNIIWKPSVGDVIEGVVKGMGTTITNFGDQDYLELTLNDSTEKTIYCNANLQKQVEAENVEEGDRIAIKFVEKVQGTGKNSKKTYFNFLLVKDDGTE